MMLTISQQKDVVQPIPTISLKAPLDTDAIFGESPTHTIEKRDRFVLFGGLVFTLSIIAFSIFIFTLSR